MSMQQNTVVFTAIRPWLQQVVRRSLLLLWWTVTLQLPKRYGMWQRARRIRRTSPIAQDLHACLIDRVDPRSIRVPRSAHPLVSVVIPSFGQVEFTLRCLASIAAHPPKAAIEVIVVDDATADGSTACLAQVQGIRLIINPRNLGYLRSCNTAARIADGEYLMLLNNDTQVMADWLDALLSPFLTRSDVGAVGSKLLYPDGRLQEAGCIVWDDGSGWNFGRLDNPDRPAYNYLREVDYCSAASLLVRRALFNGMGGFDERYAPAYCEDSDLAFRLRERGYKVIYQPRSQVIHFEGVSHGRSLSGCLKSCQVRNQRTFHDRWFTVLANQHLPSGQHVLRARDRVLGRDVILLIDHYVPEPDRDAGSRTMLCIIRGLLQAGMVVKFWPHNLHFSPGYTDALQDMGVEVAYGGDADSFRHWLADNADDIDHALLCRPQVAAAFLPELKRYAGIGLLYYGADLHFSRMRLQAQVLDDRCIARQADAMAILERSVWRDVDVVMYPSDQETAVVAAAEPDVVAHTLLPYSFADFAPPRPPPVLPLMLFVGSFAHLPNQHGVLWFVELVLPLILARVPAARFAIVGSNPSPEVRALAGGPISVQANVSDAQLRSLYREARVAAVPLRYGAGVKLKVVEALREGLPLVTTPVGAQGLPGLDLIVAICDEPQAFADAVCLLLTDGNLWAERSAAQVGYAASHYSEDVFRGSLMDALAQSAGRCAARLPS
ncbi:MAG: glycosyltransferase [Acetobacteraceae bacterium]